MLPEDLEEMPPDPRPRLSAHDRSQFRELVREVKDRQLEALKLYEPLPFQEAFHACVSKEAIIQKANQAGGSLANFAEVARAVTGQDPYKKYPKTGVAVCLGYGEGHVGRVIHRYLFRWGAFRIIRDRVTQQWRTYRPWDPAVEFHGKYGDSDRESESRPSPPLIPKRFIDGKIAWSKKSENVFTYVKFTTGWELYAFNSRGEASMAQGFQVDLYDIDEDVATAGWYEEAIGRTSIRRGKIRWAALPHAKTDDIVQMITRADNEVGQENPTTVCIRATMYDNPYYPEESKRHNEKTWKALGDDVYRKRALGELTLDSFRMYPTFSKDVHSAVRHITPIEQAHEDEGRISRSLVQIAITANKGMPLDDWCRYMVFDPGFTVGAVLFAAVPPPSRFGNFKVIYDECYISNCTAKLWGNAIEQKAANRHFQDFIIDAHGGRLRELGSGILPRRQYEKELEQRKIECEVRGPRFMNGSDDIEGRELALRGWLNVRASSNPLENGFPTLLIVVENCPNTCREMIGFRKLTTKIGGREVVTDKGNRKANVHTAECLEYFAAHGLPYVKPPMKVAPQLSMAEEIRIGRARRARQRSARFGASAFRINLGPQGDG